MYVVLAELPGFDNLASGEHYLFILGHATTEIAALLFAS